MRRYEPRSTRFRELGLEHGAVWRGGRGPESVRVWDLQVISFERETYVATLLAGMTAAAAAAAAAAYLSAVMSREPAETRPTPATLAVR